MDTFTSINIRYTATDASDNEAFCTFNITVEGMQYLKAYITKFFFNTIARPEYHCYVAS